MIKKDLQELVEKCVIASVKNGRIVESEVKKITKLLKSLSREDAIYSLELYLKGLKRVEAESTLIIESVEVLPAAVVSKIKKSLEKDYSIAQTKTVLNTSLLGGVRLTIGDVVLDNSVSGKINQLAERIV